MLNGEAHNIEPIGDKPPTVKDIVEDLFAEVCEQREIIILIGGAIIGQEKLESKAIGGNDTPPLFDWLSMIVGYLKENSNCLMKIKKALF